MAAIHYEALYAAPVDRVLAVLTDEAFLAAYAEEVGAVRYEVQLRDGEDEVSTRVAMTVPTAGVPAVFKRLVNHTVDITEQRTWPSRMTADRREGTLAVDASARGRDVRVRGALLLEPKGGSTLFKVDADVRVNVPVVGDLAASLVRDLIGSVIKRQSTVMDRWLARD